MVSASFILERFSEQFMHTNKQFTEAYEANADAIFRHCYFRISNREKAKDMMQETFTRTWEYISKGNEIANLRAFLYRTANNIIIDTYRKKKESSLEELHEQGFEPSVDSKNQIHDEIEVKSAIAAIHTLEPKYKEVILLRYVDEFTPKEIAKIVGENVNTVSVRVHRGLTELRKIIQR